MSDCLHLKLGTVKCFREFLLNGPKIHSVSSGGCLSHLYNSTKKSYELVLKDHSMYHSGDYKI